MTHHTSKIKARSRLKPILDRARVAKQTIVFTNGVFDLLHPQHIALLAQARALGDLLVVGLNSDASVHRIKGPHRPVMNERGRAEILSAIGYVDYVVLFEEDTPCALLESLRPDILVKGSDYTPEQVVGADLIHSWGGRVQIVQTEKTITTSDLIQTILDRFGRREDNPPVPPL